MSRQFVQMLLVGSCTTIAGLVAGYYFGVMGEPSLSVGLVALVGLVLLSAAIAFQTGNRAAWAHVSAPGTPHGPDALREELDRSRRFGRTFVLMRLPIQGHASRDSADARQTDGETLRMMLRSIDAAWSVTDSTYVLLPESTRRDAAQLVGRLSRALPDLVRADLVEVAEFPTDGLTMGALLANLRPEAANDAPHPMRLMRRDEGSEDPASQDRTS